MPDEESALEREGTVHRQKARRAHACAECPEPIQPGETYIYLNTFDRGKWSRYVLCSKCERIRMCHKITVLALDLELELSYAAGKMRDGVRAFHKSIPNYQHEFRHAWEDSEPAVETPP